MQPLQQFTGDVLAGILRRQPSSPGRTSLAWQMVVGSRLARVTSVELDGTVLRVRAADPRWLHEIERAQGTILPRLQHLLGRPHLTRITTR